MEQNRKAYLYLGIGMLIFALCFLFFALRNPQLSFPWSNAVTYLIYTTYFFIMILCFVFYGIKKLK